MKMITANLLIGMMLGGVVSAQHRIEADEQSLARGIAAYSIERLGKVVTVVTEDAEGLATGRYVLEFDTPKGIAIRFDDLDTSLEMFWNPMNAEFSLRDQRTGAEGTARPVIAEDGKPSFSKNDTAGVLRRHEQGTSRAFFVLHQTMINLGLYNQGEAKPRPEVIPGKPTEPAEPDDHLLVTLCPPSCTDLRCILDFSLIRQLLSVVTMRAPTSRVSAQTIIASGAVARLPVIRLASLETASVVSAPIEVRLAGHR